MVEIRPLGLLHPVENVFVIASRRVIGKGLDARGMDHRC